MARFVLIAVLLIMLAKSAVAISANRIVQQQRTAEGIALDAQLRAGEAAFGVWLDNEIASLGDSDATLPDPSTTTSPPAVATCATANCAYTGNVTFAITAQPSTSFDAHEGKNDNSYNLQRASLVHENTVSVKMIATVSTVNGGAIATATRCELATYRIARQAPYAGQPVVSSCGANVGVTLERDAGGCDPTNPGTCDPTGGTQVAPTSTLIGAQRNCKGPCTSETPQPANDYTDNNWQSGNENTSGWTH